MKTEHNTKFIPPAKRLLRMQERLNQRHSSFILLDPVFVIVDTILVDFLFIDDLALLCFDKDQLRSNWRRKANNFKEALACSNAGEYLLMVYCMAICFVGCWFLAAAIDSVGVSLGFA